jgi:FkbM family methyltransferase
MRIKERIINKFIIRNAELKKRIELYSKIIKKDDLVFDIGANHGNRVTPFLEIGSKIVAVEPNPLLANKLTKKFGRKITVIQKAIGDEIGTVELYVNDSDVLSTTSKEFIEKAKATGRFGELSNAFNNVVNVEMISIENLFKEYGYPVFIKIDTEGLEYKIIKTLNNNKVKALSFEFAIPESLEEVLLSLEYLNSIGYVKFNISFGESMDFLTHVNIDFIDFIDFISKLPKMSWGDIYAFNKL